MSPRRKEGWIPKLTHIKGRGVGRVRFPGQPDMYLGRTGVWPANQKKPPASVVKAYQKAAAEWLARGGAGATPTPPPGATTIAQLVIAYKDYVERTYRKRDSPTTEVKQVRNACKPLMRLYDDLPAERFRGPESRKVRDELLRDGKRSVQTVAVYGSKLKAMFTWGAEEGLVSEETALIVRGVRWFRRGQKGVRRRRQPVPPADFDATLPHLPATVAAMARLQHLTGMRPEEVCGMRAGDITDEGEVWKYEARDECNKLAHLGVPKIVWLGPQAQEILRPFWEAGKREGKDTPLFRPERSRRRGNKGYHPGRYKDIIAEACKRAGIPHWSPGRLRHTRGSETRKLYGKEGAQAQFGHLGAEMSERYTSSVLEELARRIARETG